MIDVNKISPRPWKVGACGRTAYFKTMILQNDGVEIGDMNWGVIGEMNAAHIVACVNSMDKAKALLRDAAATFLHYESLHAAKGTEDGVRKAHENRRHAEVIELFLQDNPPNEHP